MLKHLTYVEGFIQIYVHLRPLEITNYVNYVNDVICVIHVIYVIYIVYVDLKSSKLPRIDPGVNDVYM